MQYVSGLIYGGEKGFFRGSLGFEDGVIKEVGRREEKKALERGLVIPAFFDAHMHIGDSVVREEVRGTVAEVFGPSGFKAKRLAEATKERLVESAKQSLRNMLACGTTGFCDFREGGLAGMSALYLALFDSPVRCVALGRPAGNRFDETEVDSILGTSDGIGASALSDWDFDELGKVAAAAKAKGKLFALHASEETREDIDRIIDLKPDFLVHMTAASDSDLERCAGENLPIVVCPRSNAYFGKLVDIPRMLAKGARLMLGTDNVMLNSPSILAEMEFALRISRRDGGLSCRDAFMLALNSREVFKAGGERFEEGAKADFMVLDSLGPLDELEKDPYYHIVLRSTEANVALVYAGERIYSKANINKT